MDFIQKKRPPAGAIEDTRTEAPQGSKRRKLDQMIHGDALTPEMIKYAKFANSAYKETTAEKLAAVDNEEWRLDKLLKNNERVDVWVNDSTKEVIMSNRGTDAKSLHDLSTDVALAFGFSSATKRFKESEKHYQSVVKKYDPSEYKHSLVGHSLGGSVNTHIYHNNKDTVHSVHNFNPGSSVDSVLKGLHHKVTKADHSKVNQYFIKGDDISGFGRGDSSYTNHELHKRENSGNEHSLDQFLS